MCLKCRKEEVHGMQRVWCGIGKAQVFDAKPKLFVGHVLLDVTPWGSLLNRPAFWKLCGEVGMTGHDNNCLQKDLSLVSVIQFKAGILHTGCKQMKQSTSGSVGVDMTLILKSFWSMTTDLHSDGACASCCQGEQTCGAWACLNSLISDFHMLWSSDLHLCQQWKDSVQNCKEQVACC